MVKVEYYTDNIYTNEYYLAQYILSAVFLRKKCCYMLLTEQECNILKDRMSDLKITFLNSSSEPNYNIYKIYS